MAEGVDSREQIAMPVYKSPTANTGVAWTVATAYGVEQPGGLTYTLFDENGEEIGRKEHSLPERQFEHSALFITEIFDGLPEEFVGTLRVSIFPGVDRSLRMTDEEYEALRARVREFQKWIYGACLRMDIVPGGVNLGSLPVKAGLPRYRPEE